MGGNPKGHSRAFENMVEGPNDIVGLLAYALFKQNIREEARQGVKTDGSLRNPSDVTVGLFRSSAEQQLNAFASAAIDQATPEIRESAILSAIWKLEANLKTHVTSRTGIGGAIWSNVIAWVVTIVLSTAIVVGLAVSRVGDRMMERFSDLLAPANAVVPADPPERSQLQTPSVTERGPAR